MKRNNLLVAIILAVLYLQSSTVYGQQAKNQTGNTANYIKDNSRVGGHYEISRDNLQRGIVEHINVNYCLSPAPFTNVLHLDLATPNPTLFTADIIDANGSKLAHWSPAVKSYHYSEDIDISKLAPGSYRLNVYNEINPASAQIIPFEKIGGNN